MVANISTPNQSIALHALADALATEEVDRRLAQGEGLSAIMEAVLPGNGPDAVSRMACVNAYARLWLGMLLRDPALLEGIQAELVEGECHDG